MGPFTSWTESELQMDSAGCPHRMALTEQAGNHALLWSTSKTFVPQLPLPDSVSFADVSAELGNLQVPSRVQKEVPKGREDRERQADCSSFRENDNILAKDNRARGRRIVISNFLE